MDFLQNVYDKVFLFKTSKKHSFTGACKTHFLISPELFQAKLNSKWEIPSQWKGDHSELGLQATQCTLLGNIIHRHLVINLVPSSSFCREEGKKQKNTVFKKIALCLQSINKPRFQILPYPKKISKKLRLILASKLLGPSDCTKYFFSKCFKNESFICSKNVKMQIFIQHHPWKLTCKRHW